MNINQIHWHDAVILGVTIDPVASTVRFLVEYPVAWERNEFEPRSITFFEAFGYKEHEGPFVGPPTILEATQSPVGAYHTVRIDTNAGYREVTCKDVQLEAAARSG
ncbi:MAG: hypothetical protein QM750_22075 [Rubrivivax sp.]